jgi:hypothetical protein
MGAKKADKGAKRKRSNKDKRKRGNKDKRKHRKKDKLEQRAASASPSAEATDSEALRATKTPDITDSEIPASKAVVHEWARRVEAEYRSAAITQHLTLWLIQMGASPDLIHDGLRIVADELAHADLSFKTFAAAGGTSIAPIARESLSLAAKPGEQLEEAVTRWGVEVFCLGETVAVPLFKVLRDGCIVSPAREALDRVLRDEVRHREFGWTLLEYLVETPNEELVRRVVDQELAGMFARVQRSYAPVGGEARTSIPDADRAWGLMPIARYREILERTLERDYRPRFNRLGFEIDAAWKEGAAMRTRASA